MYDIEGNIVKYNKNTKVSKTRNNSDHDYEFVDLGIPKSKSMINLDLLDKML